MGMAVLILGRSGSGKSYSLRNFQPGEVGIMSVLGKPLPFAKRLDFANLNKRREDGTKPNKYEIIRAILRRNRYKCYVVDDANYLMQLENFEMAYVKGYDKFVKMAVNFENMLDDILTLTDENTIVYLMMHPDSDEYGNTKPKTVGKMLDNQLTIEGLVPITIETKWADGGYYFRVRKNSEGDIVKVPPEVIEALEIEGDTMDNDLRTLDTAIRSAYGFEPIAAVSADG